MVSKLLHALTASFITQAIHTPVSMIDVVKITSLEQSEVWCSCRHLDKL